MRGPAGPLVDFVVVTKRWQERVAEAPAVGACRDVDGKACIVRRVVETAPGQLRVWLAPGADVEAQ